MERRLLVLGAALLVTPLGTPSAVHGQQQTTDADTVATLADVLREHRIPLTLEDDELAGTGAELLLEEAAASRYLVVGETHGVAETPELIGALFRELRPAGYRHLVVEIGPIQAERIGEVLAAPRPMETFAAFLAEHWPGVPFYGWRSEAELLAEAVRLAGPGALWGIDYDILADRYPLHRLRELAPDSAARAAADQAIAVADSLLERAMAEADPSQIAMFSQPESTWASLREAYTPEPGSEADRILAQLEATARINEAWTSGRRWRSNRLRVGLLKRNLLRQLAGAGPDARVIVKMGGFHLMRGRTPNNTFDVGNLLSEHSIARAARTGDAPEAGSRSFHVLVFGAPGGERGALDPRDWSVRRVPTVTSNEGHWASRLTDALFDESSTVIDLRPLRPMVDAGEAPLDDLPERFEETIFAYDAVVVLHGSTPAEAVEVERPARFRP